MTQVIVRYGQGPEVYCPHRAPPKQWAITSLQMGRGENKRVMAQRRGRNNGHTIKRFSEWPDGVWTCGICDAILGARPMVGDHCDCGAVVTTSRYREVRDGGERRRHGPGGGAAGGWLPYLGGVSSGW